MSCVCAESCPTLCDPVDCSPPVSSVEFTRKEYWSGWPLPPPWEKVFSCQILGMNCLARSQSEMKHFSLLTFNQEAKIFLFFFFNIYLFAGSSLLLGLSLVAAGEEYSLAPVCGLLIVACGIQSAGPVVVICGLSSSSVGKVFADH